MRLLARAVATVFVVFFVRVNKISFFAFDNKALKFDELKLEENSHHEKVPSISDCTLLNSPQNLGKNIFFIESSGAKDNDSNTPVSLTSRSACCIESAAIKNPDYNIFIVIVTRNLLNATKQIQILKSYKNVNFLHVDLHLFSRDTPLEEWIDSGKLYDTDFIAENVSNILRILLLWKYVLRKIFVK